MSLFQLLQSKADTVPGVSWSSPAFLWRDSGARMRITNLIKVRLEDGVDPGLFFGRRYAQTKAIGVHTFAVTLKAGGGPAAIAEANRLRKDPNVVWSEPGFYQPILWFTELTGWNLGPGSSGNAGGANVQAAWSTTAGSADVTVAVLDCGVQMDHPDLAANIFTNTDEIDGNHIDDDRNGYVDDMHGWDFVGGADGIPDNDPSPATVYDKHGTAVAGVAAAVRGNDLGISGAAPGVRIMPLKITRFDGPNPQDGDWVGISSAIYYAAGAMVDASGNPVAVWRGADVINASWGQPGSDSAIGNAMDWASANGRGGLGMPIFAASGNSASGYPYNPTTVPAGNGDVGKTYHWRIDYHRGSGGTSTDAVRLANFQGTEFTSLTTPSGWNLTPVSGQSGWAIEDNPTYSYGTARYQLKSAALSNNQDAYVQAPDFVCSGSLATTFRAWLDVPDDTHGDYVRFTLFERDDKTSTYSEVNHWDGTIALRPSFTTAVAFPGASTA